MAIIQGCGSIGLPQPHIAIVDAGEYFSYEAGTDRLGHGKSGHWVPEKINSIGQSYMWAQFADSRRHGGYRCSISMQRVRTITFIAEQQSINATFLQYVKVAAQGIDNRPQSPAAIVKRTSGQWQQVHYSDDRLAMPKEGFKNRTMLTRASRHQVSPLLTQLFLTRAVYLLESSKCIGRYSGGISWKAAFNCMPCRSRTRRMIR